MMAAILIPFASTVGVIVSYTIYVYNKETRAILSTDLIPDSNHKKIESPKEFTICNDEFIKFTELQQTNLYKYIIHLSLNKILFPLLSPLNNSLKCIDIGCGPGGLSFLLSEKKEIFKIYGIDLSPSNINYANEKLLNMKQLCIIH